MTRDRHLTTTMQADVHGALGAHADMRGRMIQRCDQRFDAVITAPTFNADRALADGGQTFARLQKTRDARAEAEANQTGCRQ